MATGHGHGAWEMHRHLRDDAERHSEMRHAIAAHRLEAAELRRRHPHIAAIPLTPRALQQAASLRADAEAEHAKLEAGHVHIEEELRRTRAALAAHSKRTRVPDRHPPTIELPVGDQQQAGGAVQLRSTKQGRHHENEDEAARIRSAGQSNACTPPRGHEEAEHLSATRRSQYELRVSSESSVGIPATLLAGFAIDMLAGLRMDSSMDSSVRAATALEALFLAVVVLINLAGA